MGKKEEVRQRNVDFIKRDLTWPHLYLPLKRHKVPGELPECGILTDPIPKVHLTNMWRMDLRTCEVLTYNSIEEMVDDGWEVD